MPAICTLIYTPPGAAALLATPGLAELGESGVDGVGNRPPERIEAPPVLLRRYRANDLEPLVEAVSSSVDHLKPWLGWASVEPLEAGLMSFLSHSVETFDRGENFDYAIWSGTGSVLLGGAGLHPRLGPGRIEIGYWVRDGWLRRGVASAAASALTTAAFQLPGIEEVHIHCDAANLASAAIPQRLGFRLLQIVDDDRDAPAEIGRSMEWAMRAGEWQAVP